MLWRVLDLGASPKEAIEAPRFHNQLLPNVVSLFDSFFRSRVRLVLTPMRQLNMEETWSNGTFDFMGQLGHDTEWGNVGVDLHLIRRLDNGTFEAAAESRLNGSGGFAV